MGFDGFDSVELLMALEDTFGIAIPDRDAERIKTAGQLSDYICRRIPVKDADPDVRCASAAAFYRVRRKLVQGLSIKRRDVRPG